MESDSYVLYDYVNNAVSRGSLTELQYLWAPTPWMGDQGVIIRTMINRQVPNLAEFHGIKLKKVLSFPEFMKEYDKRNYEQECSGNPEHCLFNFVVNGNIRGVNIAIQYDIEAWVWNKALALAIKKDQVDIFKLLFKKYPYDTETLPWSILIKTAVETDNKALLELLIYKRRNRRIAEYYANLYNRKDIIAFLS